MSKDTLVTPEANVQITKKDAYWSYLAQFLSISSGIFVLPIILNKLSTTEIGFNYILLTLTSLVSLFDFGFSPQFGRNISYVFSGAKTLKKEGVDSVIDSQINYRLLATVIQTARYLYRRLAIVSTLFLVTVGSIYVYRVSDGFQSIHHLLIIWVVYIASVYFNIYFLYYNSLLMGKGLIKEAQKGVIVSKCLNIGITVGLLFGGLGLLSVVIANLVSPFGGRYVSYHFFYTKELKSRIKQIQVMHSEVRSTFKIVWYNAKRVGLVSLSGFCVSQLGLFLSGLYLPLSEVASYGLTVQLAGIISAISGTLLSIQAPFFSACRVQGLHHKLMERFSCSLIIFYVLYALGSLLLILVVPSLLQVIKSNATLPTFGVLITYTVFRFLENNHYSFTVILLSNNSVPFLKATLISSAFTFIGLFIVVYFTDWGILGLIFVPAVVQAVYQYWKWPKVVCKEFQVSYLELLRIGCSQLKTQTVSIWKNRY